MSHRPRKFQRVSKACDFCNRRSIKCNKNNGPLAPCQNCVDFDVPCTYDRPARRRGARRNASPTASQTTQPIAPGQQVARDEDLRAAPGILPNTVAKCRTSNASWESLNGVHSVAGPSDGSAMTPWKAFATACQDTIRDLAQVYLEIVYPIFPLFYWPSFSKALDNMDYLHDDGFFASTMAMCALTSARARDGALYSTRWSSQQLSTPPSEVFWAAAKESIPRDLSTARGTEYMRACAILSIASIQHGQIQGMQQYLGFYHTLATMDGLQDEKFWPKDLDPVVVEVRRRLFWSIYTLDVYSSIVWGGVIRHREAQSNVRYPGEVVKDEFISKHTYASSPHTEQNGRLSGPGLPHDWISGWNFITDMYRILEHAVDSQRRRSPPTNGISDVWSLFRPAQTAGTWLMDHVLSMYSALPPQFRETRPVTGDLAHDIFGFQSANIQATLQLLRMVLAPNEDQGVDEKCDVVGQVLSVFSKVPVEYLKAISSPLLHHLAGIGYILGSVMEGSLSEASYQRVRTLLLEMADLLHRLESGLRRPTGTSERLRAQVARIDEYMLTKRSAPTTTTLPPPPRPPSVLNPGSMQEDMVPSVYQQPPSLAPIQAPLAPMPDPVAQFQLPPELLNDWPWPFDAGVSEGVFPYAFVK
ncbi:putative C6 transcription factor [Aspergillus undulatus]|uniref:putative C6 transcription factor n=1 Tax=Aspergillus undulatus TaxID=1810928 RepID=UPI003CCD14E5